MAFVTGFAFVSKRRHVVLKKILCLDNQSLLVHASSWVLFLPPNFPSACYGEIVTTSGQLQRNQLGLEGWTLLTYGVPMNIFRLKELTVQKSNSLIFSKGQVQADGPH